MSARTATRPQPPSHAEYRPFRYGNKVRVKNTALFNDRVGIVCPTSGHPDDIWDHYVSLEPDGIYGGQMIGVSLDQIEHIDDEPEEPVTQH